MIHNNNKSNNNENNNNKNNNQYKVIINISLTHIFDVSILLSASKKVVNKLRQIVYKPIEIYELVLNIIVRLYQ